MIIKEAKYKNVMVKQRKCVSETVYGCDDCKAEIKEYPNEENRLEMTVYRNNDEKTEHLHFCSWDCVLNHIPKVKTDYFISLPYIYCDARNGSKRGSKQLIKLLTERGKKK